MKSKKCPTCKNPTPNFIKSEDGPRIPDLCNSCREHFRTQHEVLMRTTPGTANVKDAAQSGATESKKDATQPTTTTDKERSDG